MRSVVFAVVVCGLGASNVVRAQTQDDAIPQEARVAFAQAESAYQRELFTEAEDGFRRTYELFPATNPRRSLILLNIALVVERQTGRDAEALELWQRFRREAATVAEAEHLLRADDRIRELSARIERRRSAAASAAPEPAAPAPAGFSPVGPIVLGVGVAALAAGAILGGTVLAQDEMLVAMCPAGRCDDPSAVTLASEVEQLAIATDVLFIAGAAVAVAGVLLTILVRDEPVQASAGCGPTECSAVLTGRF